MTTLSPPPQNRTIGTALVGGKPVAVQADIAWFRYWATGVFDRIGGATGASNAELAALIAALQVALDVAEADIVDLRADLTALSGDVTTLQGDLTALSGDVAAIALRVTAIEAETMPKALQYDYIDATTAYRGEAEPGALTSAAAWRIQRITITGDDVEIEWAGGSSALTQIWDNRAGLTYS